MEVSGEVDSCAGCLFQQRQPVMAADARCSAAAAGLVRWCFYCPPDGADYMLTAARSLGALFTNDSLARPTRPVPTCLSYARQFCLLLLYCCCCCVGGLLG